MSVPCREVNKKGGVGLVSCLATVPLSLVIHDFIFFVYTPHMLLAVLHMYQDIIYKSVYFS